MRYGEFARRLRSLGYDAELILKLNDLAIDSARVEGLLSVVYDRAFIIGLAREMVLDDLDRFTAMLLYGGVL